MRILLISANMEQLPDPVVPLGLAYLSSALKSQSFEVKVLDLCFEMNIEEALRSSCLAFQPEAIGISLRNLDNVSFPQSVSYLPFYKRVVELCRQFSRAPIFLGGSGFTLMPKAILAHLKADGGIVGEGEEVFPKLLHTFESGTASLPCELEGADGFVAPRLEEKGAAAFISDLNRLPSPDWDCLDLPRYFRRGGMGNLQTKRGCSFACIYCTYPLIEGKEIRLRSPDQVARDAEALVRRGVENAFVVDNIFNYPPSHAGEVCRILAEKRIPLKWSCYAHPSWLSEGLAEDMKKAGCTGMEFGTDSGSSRVLSRLGKNFGPDEIRRATRLARQAGLEVCHSLSLGAPGETRESLEETFSLMEELSPTAVIAMLGLRIFPGTGLARLAQEEGVLLSDHDFLQPTFYIAPEIKDRIVELACRKAETRPNWIFPGLGINVSSRLQSKLRQIGVKGPLWEHMKVLRGGRLSRGGPHV